MTIPWLRQLALMGPVAPLMPQINAEYEAHTGNKVIDDFPEWEPVHRILFTNGILGIENVGGDIDKVTGKRCTFSFFPWRWTRVMAVSFAL